MNRDELRNALSGVKSLSISVDDYIYFQQLRSEAEAKGINLSDEPLSVDPFYLSLADDVYLYRCAILKAYGCYEKRGGWFTDPDSNAKFSNQFLKTASLSDFRDEVEKQFNVKIT